MQNKENLTGGKTELQKQIDEIIKENEKYFPDDENHDENVEFLKTVGMIL